MLNIDLWDYFKIQNVLPSNAQTILCLDTFLTLR